MRDFGIDPKEGELSDLEKELILYFGDFVSDRLRKLLIKFAKLMIEYDPGQDTADNLIKDSKNPEFAAELLFNMYLKDLVEDNKKEEK